MREYMRYEFRVRGRINQKIKIDTQQEKIAILYREDKAAAGLLMKKAVSSGSSVILYGNDTSFYQFIHECEPPIVHTVDSKRIYEELRVPFLMNSAQNTQLTLREHYVEYMYQGKYEYFVNRNGVQLPDPSRYLSYYQIKAGNTQKERFITESFLLNIISQAMYGNPIHEVSIFLADPFKPITKVMMRFLEEAPLSVNLIVLYKDCNHGSEKYGVYSDSNGIYIQQNRRKYEVIE
jgi:hypothetical protein